MARVFQLSWFKQAKKLPVRGIRLSVIAMTSRASRFSARKDSRFGKGVLGWKKISTRRCVSRQRVPSCKNAYPLAEVNTSANPALRVSRFFLVTLLSPFSAAAFRSEFRQEFHQCRIALVDSIQHHASFCSPLFTVSQPCRPSSRTSLFLGPLHR